MAMTNRNPLVIQKTYPIIEFSEVSHSKGRNILPERLSLKIGPYFDLFPENFNCKFKISQYLIGYRNKLWGDAVRLVTLVSLVILREKGGIEIRER